MKNNEYVCGICKKSFSRLLDLHTHISYHGYKGVNGKYQYYVDYANLEWPTCPYCKTNPVATYSNNFSRGFKKSCTNKDCIKQAHRDIQLEVYDKNPELRKIHQVKRIEYLKTNYENTAWANRANKIPSFLEKTFIEDFVKQNNLDQKYSIVSEYSVYPYFLDFAFVDIKLDVELDGRCHFSNGIKRIQHDIDRDQHLINKGWKIYRISYTDIENNKQETIKNFLDKLSTLNFDYNAKYFETGIKTYAELKKSKKENKQLRKNKKIENIHNTLLKIAKDDSIDLTKFGWNGTIINLLMKQGVEVKSNIRRFITRHCPEFFDLKEVYNKKTSRRGSRGSSPGS